MSAVTGILCQIITGNVDGAGTDGHVYLGIGGREFLLDTDADDFERNSWREYILGKGPVEPNLPPRQVRVLNPELNDPSRGYRLDTDTIKRCPVYIRLEPAGNRPEWLVNEVAVIVYTPRAAAIFQLPDGVADVWLGSAMGKVLHLTQEWWIPPRLEVKLNSTVIDALRANVGDR